MFFVLRESSRRTRSARLDFLRIKIQLFHHLVDVSFQKIIIDFPTAFITSSKDYEKKLFALVQDALKQVARARHADEVHRAQVLQDLPVRQDERTSARGS